MPLILSQIMTFSCVVNYIKNNDIICNGTVVTLKSGHSFVKLYFRVKI